MPDQVPYAVIEPPEKGDVRIFMSAVQQMQTTEIIKEWSNTLGVFFNENLIDSDTFNRTVDYLTTEQSLPSFDRDLRTNLIKRLHEKELIVAAFIAAWRAYERKAPKPPPRTSL
jgi:hypothetical protein